MADYRGARQPGPQARLREHGPDVSAWASSPQSATPLLGDTSGPMRLEHTALMSFPSSNPAAHMAVPAVEAHRTAALDDLQAVAVEFRLVQQCLARRGAAWTWRSASPASAWPGVAAPSTAGSVPSLDVVLATRTLQETPPTSCAN